MKLKQRLLKLLFAVIFVSTIINFVATGMNASINSEQLLLPVKCSQSLVGFCFPEPMSVKPLLKHYYNN